jgi:hypothetical protein
MTTQIIVNAHCGEEKEVEIKIEDPVFDHGPEITILQDGESKDDIYVYDERTVSVKEIEKKDEK